MRYLTSLSPCLVAYHFGQVIGCASTHLVDWAALAKQWMQFRDAGEASGPPPPPPLPPPQNNLPSVPQSQIAPSNWSGASWNNPSSTNADSRPWNNLMADDWTSTLESEVCFLHWKGPIQFLYFRCLSRASIDMMFYMF
mgnify:CR=1